MPFSAIGLDTAVTHAGDRPRGTALRFRLRRLEDEVRAHDMRLREVDHRAKNALQLAVSLLQIQARGSDGRTAAALNSASGRLLRIAEVHERFYTGTDAEQTDAAAHVRRLLTGLAEALGATPAQVVVAVEADELVLSPERMLPLALLVGEVMTNAFKHAFPGGRAGQVAATLRRRGPDMVLVIRDDGVGLPAHGREGSLGMDLIAEFAARLGGTALVAPAPAGGTQVTVTFPVDAPASH